VERFHHVSLPLRRLLHSLAVLLLLLAVAPSARGDDGISGTWQGEYICNQGVTGLTLTVAPSAGSEIHAVFRFYAVPSNSSVPDGCFEMSGRFESETRKVTLTAGSWLLKPSGYVSVDLSGTVDADVSTMRGIVIGPACTNFTLRHVASGPRKAPVACHGDDMVMSQVG
jgi:hypothetical protein